MNPLDKLFSLLRGQPAPAPQQPVSPLLAHVDPSKLLPAEATLRLGTGYGGWIIPADAGLDAGSTCYLVGAGEDISFDCALVREFGCRVRVIDPTPRAVQHFNQLTEAVRAGRKFAINKSATDFYDLTEAQLRQMSFLPVGLSDQDVELKFYMPKNPEHVSCSSVNLQKTEEYFIAQCHRMATIMAMQGDSRVDLLKIDIEGAEYSVINNLVETKLLPRLLLVEFDEAHSPLDADAGKRIGDSMRRVMGAGMRCVAVEGSNATFVRDSGRA
jgi:FkbM family methyltransferase